MMVGQARTLEAPRQGDGRGGVGQGGRPGAGRRERADLPAPCTRTPYTAKYVGADANKTAHYMLRRVNTRGQKGPWSETASATIGA